MKDEYIKKQDAIDRLYEAMVRSNEHGGYEVSGLITAKCQIEAIPVADVGEIAIDVIEYLEVNGLLNMELLYIDTLKSKINFLRPHNAHPLVHGHWLKKEQRLSNTDMQCSNCNRILRAYEGFKANYCPNCGAKMDL